MAVETGRKQRGPGRPFRKGESGNPRGRPRGSGPAAKVRAAIAEDVPVIIKRLAELAKSGDVAAARVLLDRVVPALKAETLPVSIPGIDVGTLAERAQAALSAVGRGEVAPDTAATLVAAVGALARIIEVDELERRIAALEAARAK